MSRTLKSLALVLLFAALGALAWVGVVQNRPRPPQAPPRALSPVPVHTTRLARRGTALEVRALGTLRPARRALLGFDSAGEIARVHPGWREGARVQQGELLAALDDETQRLDVLRSAAARDAALARRSGAETVLAQVELTLPLARERLDLLQREEERWVRLAADGTANDSQVDSSRAQRGAAALALAEAQTAVERARADLTHARAQALEAQRAHDLAARAQERTQLFAPFSGALVGRPPAPGTRVAPGAALVELLDLSHLELVLRVPEDELQGIVPGLEARVGPPSARTGAAGTPTPGGRAGRVAAVAAELDPSTRSAAVEIDIPMATDEASSNGGGESRLDDLLVGQLAEARIHVATLPDALVIERSHATERRGQRLAFVVEEAADGTLVARTRNLRLGRAVGDGWVVLEGLRAGERLITSPLPLLTEGTPIELASAAEPPATSGPSEPTTSETELAPSETEPPPSEAEPTPSETEPTPGAAPPR